MSKPSEVPHLRALAEGEVIALDVELSAEQLRAAKWRSKLYTGDEILSAITPREWFIPDWLPRDGAVSIYGPSGIGKSFYALAMSLELARGGNFASYKVDPARVLYVAAERPIDQRDRLEAWQLHYDRDTPSTFQLLAASPQIHKPDHRAELIKIIKENSAQVVMLDTFARMTVGLDENSSKEMGRAMEALDEIREATNGGVVSVLHHTGKDSSKGARGSTAFLAALDVGIALSGDSKALKVYVDKANAGPEPMPEWYKIQTQALPPLSPTGPARLGGVLVGTYAKEVATEKDPMVLALLLEAGVQGMSAKEILEALETDGEKSNQTQVSRVLRRLEASKSIGREGSANRPRYYSVISHD